MITKQREEDMLVGAIEGGSNYWYFLGDDANKIIRPYIKGIAYSEAMYAAIQDGKSIPVRDAEDEDEVLGEINLASIEKGNAIMIKEDMDTVRAIVNETDDAFTADNWFQYAALGEIVYC